MIILDRFEAEFAVLETDDGMENVPRTQIPTQAKEGDILCRTPNGYAVDETATAKRREKLLARTKKLTKK